MCLQIVLNYYEEYLMMTENPGQKAVVDCNRIYKTVITLVTMGC